LAIHKHNASPKANNVQLGVIMKGAEAEGKTSVPRILVLAAIPAVALLGAAWAMGVLSPKTTGHWTINGRPILIADSASIDSKAVLHLENALQMDEATTNSLLQMNPANALNKYVIYCTDPVITGIINIYHQADLTLSDPALDGNLVVGGLREQVLPLAIQEGVIEFQKIDKNGRPSKAVSGRIVGIVFHFRR
jgi:hypothetical protein